MQSITEDNGVKKRIIKEAPNDSSEQTIKTGTKVAVEYIGRLNSSKKEFDRSIEGYPFSFVLGKGEVIKGWEIALQSMKVGEHAEFVVSPEYGYGESGDRSKDGENDIPPNAELLFEIKVISAGAGTGIKQTTADTDLERLEQIRRDRQAGEAKRKEQEEETKRKKEAAKRMMAEKLRNKQQSKKGKGRKKQK